MNRRLLPLLALTALGVAALTACDPSATTSSTPSGASSATSSSAPSQTPTSGATPTQTATTVSTPVATASKTAANPLASSDSYAYKHACTGAQLDVKGSYDPSLGATKRVITVVNHGSTSCGLDYYPTLALVKSSTINTGGGTAVSLEPKVPGGLGGAPAYPLYAGQTAYAVIDLNPSHATAGASTVYDELDILATSSESNAEMLDYKVVAEPAGTGNPAVLHPVLGLYRSTVADAASSAASA